MMLSTIDYEWTIGEDGINSVCDLVNAYVVNDIMDVAAPAGFIFLLPLIAILIFNIITTKERSKILLYAGFTALLTISWWWSFFGKFSGCTFSLY